MIAPKIIEFFPEKIDRLVEPFSGTYVISILAATENKLSEEYLTIWEGQFQPNQNNINYFYKVRNEFNYGKKDAIFISKNCQRCCKI